MSVVKVPLLIPLSVAFSYESEYFFHSVQQFWSVIGKPWQNKKIKHAKMMVFLHPYCRKGFENMDGMLDVYHPVKNSIWHADYYEQLGGTKAQASAGDVRSLGRPDSRRSIQGASLVAFSTLGLLSVQSASWSSCLSSWEGFATGQWYQQGSGKWQNPTCERL